MAESKHHTRLKNLLFNICSKVTRGLLPVLIQKLPKFHNMSVDQFVKHHKSKIQGYEIGKRNYYILFPTQQQPTDIQKWDLQLLCFIIVDILGQQQRHCTVVADVGALRTIRNALCHGPNTHISETNYTIYLQQIKGMNKSFLNLIGDENLRKEIDVETDDFINDRQNIQEALGALKEWLEKDKDLQKEPCTLNEEQKQILTYLTSILENQKNIKIPDFQLVINIKNCNPEHEDTICRKFVDSVNEKVKESPLLLSQKDEVTAEIGRIVEKTFKEFFTDNQILVGAELGCVIIKVKSETFRSLEQLWTKCVNGELSQAFNTLQTYLRETYQNEVEIEVMLPEIEFWEVIRKIVNDLKEETPEKRNEESCLEGKVVNIIKRPSSDNGTDIEMVLRPKTQSELEYMRECETSGKLNESFRKMEGEFMKQLNLKDITINAKLSVQETRDQMSIPSTSGDYYRPPLKAVPHQAQIRDQTYLNWVRAGLSLKYTKEGIESFIDNEAREFHSSLLNQLGQPPQNCGQCTVDNLLPHHQSACSRRTTCICSRGPRNMRRFCPISVCGTLFDAIVSEHRFKGPSWKNSDISQWVTDHWEIAKNFLPNTGGYKNVKSATDTDLSGLVSIGINMKNITHRHNLTVSSDAGPDEFIKCRTARNEILHNASQSLSDVDLTHYLNDMKATLQCTAALQNDATVQQAVTKLTQLETSAFEVTDENVTEVRQMALLALQDEGSKQVEAIKEVGEKQKQFLKCEGSGQVNVIKEEGEKQKESVVSSVIQAENRALDEVGLESDRQRKVIKTEVEVAVENIQDKGNQQVETLNVVGEKQIKKIGNEGSDQVKAVMDEGEKQKHLLKCEGSGQVDVVKEEGEKQKHILKCEGSGQVDVVKGEGEKQKHCVIVSGIQAEKKALENIQDKGIQQVEAVNVAGEQQIKNIQQATTIQEDTRYQEEKKKLKRRLIETYRAQIQPATLPDVDRLYVEPSMKLVTDDKRDTKDNNDTNLQEHKSINMTKVFFQKQKQFSRIYISGDAGHGKTALCKMLVLAWCQEHSGDKINEHIPKDFLKVMKKFDLLFYITLRNFRKSWIISEIIKKHYFSDSDFLNMFIKNECDKSSCLVILDGLDEWLPPDNYKTPMHTTHGLPDLRHFERFTVLTTTRPLKLEVLRLGPQEMDRQVQLKGIDRSASDRYIKDMVDLLNKKKNIRKNSEDFKQQLEDKDLEHFLNIPILLKQLIMLWYDNEKELTGRSQVHVYSTIINHLLKDACERNKKKPLSAGNTQESELPLCLKEKQYCKIHKSLLLSLAQLAFTSAAKGELVFDHVEAELQNLTKGDINSCLTAGLLCQEIYASPLDEEKKKLSFLHKSFQDFLAAVFLVLNPESAQLSQTCNTFDKILEMRSLFIFVSGLDSKVMTSLSHQVQNILEKDEKWKQYNSQLDLLSLELIQNLLCECVEESKKSGQPLPYCHLKTVVIRYGDFKNLQHLIRTNMSCLQNVYVDKNVKGITEDLLTCLSLVSECRSVQHVSLALGMSLCNTKEALLDKAWCDNWSLSSLSIGLQLCEPCYRYLHSDRVATLVILEIKKVNISSHIEYQRLLGCVERATQLKKLDLFDIDNIECRMSRKSSCHLDLSHCSHLQEFSLRYCDITKVTINTTSLTDCYVSGTPVYFVSHPHVEIMKLTLESVDIIDPHYLDEIVKFLPHVTQLSCNNLKFISDEEKESSRHLDLSHCSHLQEFTLWYCDITKVTINTTSLTHCYVSGTPVYFVSHPHVETMTLTLILREIRDPHYLAEFVKFLPHLTQLSCLWMKYLDFGDGDGDVNLFPKATHLERVQLDSVTMTDRAMIKFLDSILTINHKVDCQIEGKLNEAVKTHIISRSVVTGKYLNNLRFHSQPAAH